MNRDSRLGQTEHKSRLSEILQKKTSRHGKRNYAGFANPIRNIRESLVWQDDLLKS